MSYQSFVGLEIHIQLATQTKVFCSCRANFGDEPNTNICPVCMGYPGTLPALNQEAMRLGYVVANALNCTLSPLCEFERKNYFYPDLPKNYQISQFALPLGTDGYIDLEFRGIKKRVKIRECHLEEDAGKMIHAGDQSLLDYNRAGTPLLEIVTDPDLEIGEEAEALLQEFRRLVRYLDVCDGNMEEGSLRCDANISINTQGAGLGTKVEIKNMNSFRFVRKALNYEIERQQDILERGGNIVQETRLWNENRDVSEPMRVKEASNDYRFFPEPDMPPFRTDETFLETVTSRIVELPWDRMARFGEQYQLSESQTRFLCDERETADFYEATVELGGESQVVASWLMGDVQKELNKHSLGLVESPLTPFRLHQLLDLLGAHRIHGKLAKQTLQVLFEEDKDPTAIISERNWEQITDPSQIASHLEAVITAHPQAVEQIRQGDARPRGFLVGQVMKATGGRADPGAVQMALEQLLSLHFVQVLSFGGAISGRTREDGVVVPGDMDSLLALANADASLPADIRYTSLELGGFLSEEVTPGDWASLIAAIATHLEEGVTGIVVTTGTDTLAYTAGLLDWLFSSSGTPVVLAASPETAKSPISIQTFKTAIQSAVSGDPGVRVVYADQTLPARNLKFERVPGTSGGPVFRTWNADQVSSESIDTVLDADITGDILASRMESAVRSCHVVRIFPGMQASVLTSLIDAGVRFFVLELYDTGTANLRESPFSLRKALEYGQEKGAAFFCTSQQEGHVEFSRYLSSHELWREGAIPMGYLTTESVYTRLLSVLMTTEEWETPAIVGKMEQSK